MSGPSRREEQDRRSQQPVKRFSRPFTLRGLFNKLTGLLGIRALFNFFARPRGPRPVPVKIDPAWFPVPHTVPSAGETDWTPPWAEAFNVVPQWQPPWVEAFADSSEAASDDDFVDEYAFAEDNPGWDEEPPEPEEDTITVKPGERVPTDAGELLRTYYAPGIGDVRVFARLDPNDIEIVPEEDFEPGNLKRDFNTHFRPKGPKKLK